MQKVYLAIDLGAESGRVIAGGWNGRRLKLHEVYRFPNGPVGLGGSIRWDVLRLWAEIQTGLMLAGRQFGGRVVSVGVDTWGVDFVLLNKQEELLGLPYHYRDARTRGLMRQAFRHVPRPEIYARSGVQFMELNTLYQLLAWKRDCPAILDAADTLLFMPDFFHWAMSGVKRAEFTIASTSQFLHPRTGHWSKSLLRQLGLPTHFLPQLVPPGTVSGRLLKPLAERTGLSGVKVVVPPSHDTASAVAGVPTAHTGRTNWAYLSSGTWSLLGVEVGRAIVTPQALNLNLTNEGGIEGTYRLMNNIMGLWLVQQCRRAFELAGRTYTHAGLAALAAKAGPARAVIDVNDSRFINPPDMPAATQAYCRETRQPVPGTDAELIRCCYESLAHKYGRVLGSLEALTGGRIEVLHVVGGGSQSRLLNQLTANICRRPVLAGPVEATAFGNLLTQVKADGELATLAEMREVVRVSNAVVTFEPQSRPAVGRQSSR